MIETKISKLILFPGLLVIANITLCIYACSTLITVKENLVLLERLQEDTRYVDGNISHRSDPTVIKNIKKTGSDNINPEEQKESDVNDVLSAGELLKIRNLIEDTGLDKLAETVDIFPEEIQALFINKKNEIIIKSRLNDSKKLCNKQYGTDAARHGAKINMLYLRARINFPSLRNDIEQPKEKLFNEYPDSYAAARIACSETIKFSQDKEINIQKAEDYFNTLVRIQNTKQDSIVMENGMEAVPCAAHSLIKAYHQTGQTDDAENMAAYLENYFPDNIYEVPKPGMEKTYLASGKEAMDIINNMQK